VCCTHLRPDEILALPDAHFDLARTLRSQVAPSSQGTGTVRVTRHEAVELVAPHGWFVARATKRGYLIMRCSCGDHQETLHKTPSNPNHFRLKVARMIAVCSGQVP